MSRKLWNPDCPMPQEFQGYLEEDYLDLTDDSDGCSGSNVESDMESDEKTTTFDGSSIMYEVPIVVVESDSVVPHATEGVSRELAGQSEAVSSNAEDFQFVLPLAVAVAARGRGGQRGVRRGGRRGWRRGGVRVGRAVGEGGNWSSECRPTEVYSSDDQFPPEFLPSRCGQTVRRARGRRPRLARVTARATGMLGRSDYQSASGTTGELDESSSSLGITSDDEVENAPSASAAYLFPDDPSATRFSWAGISTFAGQREQFAHEMSGPTTPFYTAYDAFRGIWTDEILDLIVVQTNKYAEDTRRRGRLSSKWKETNRHEILILFAFFMMLGINRMPTIRSCYSTSWLLETNVFKKLLTIVRYRELVKYLHFADNDQTYTDRNDQKIGKILPIINLLNAKFQELYVPKQNISIDESLTLWKGQLCFKQYIKTKAVRFGIKTFEVCESETGYLWSFFIYTGKDNSLFGTLSEKVLKSTLTVIKLITPLLNKGYTLWMDNWFNSPLLARYLKRNKTDCVGTLRTNRADVPPAFSRIDMAEGNFFGRHAGDVAILSWQDKKKVTTISTYHGVEMESGPSRGRRDIYKPKVVRDYNRYMGGVDKKDQMLEPFLIERKRCRKWYLKLFKRLLNVSIHNASVMYSQSTVSETPNLKFRLKLVQELTEWNLRLVRPLGLTPRSLLDPFSNPSRLCPVPAHYPEFNDAPQAGNSHDPDPDPATKNRRQRCVWCTCVDKVRKRTPYCCHTCKVPLCVVPCFQKYHTH